MAIELPDARHLPDEVLKALRLRALHGCEQGYTESSMAELFGVVRETISRWWSAYVEGGLEAIPQDRTGRPRGSGRTLNDEQGLHIQSPIPDKRAHTRRAGNWVAALDPACRSRFDPQGIRHHDADTNRW